MLAFVSSIVASLTQNNSLLAIFPYVHFCITTWSGTLGYQCAGIAVFAVNSNSERSEPQWGGGKKTLCCHACSCGICAVRLSRWCGDDFTDSTGGTNPFSSEICTFFLYLS